jgi:hypothetical protein
MDLLFQVFSYNVARVYEVAQPEGLAHFLPLADFTFRLYHFLTFMSSTFPVQLQKV